MSRTETESYYDQRYSVQRDEAFPFDPARYRNWFGTLLDQTDPGARMLDYGCGVGFACSLFADLGYEATGMDISTAALEIAKQREPRATFLEAPPGPLPFDDQAFDIVACLGVIEHIASPVPVVAELRRVARQKALGIWVVPNARSPYFWLAGGTEQIEEHPRSLAGWTAMLNEGGWEVTNVRRDPGPLDRPVPRWKKRLQAGLNQLPLSWTYQFVIETRPLPASSG